MPMITDVTDCADFSKTVLPYLNQLYAFYTSENAKPIDLTDVDAWKHLYTATNPVVTALVFSIATWPIFFLVSEINKNYSQVDRVWSILPTIYNVHYAIWARLNGMPTRRVDNVMAFSMLWSLRLTFNYWRRGGYQVGSEDYRWQIIKKYIGGPAFFLLNVVFISTLQIVGIPTLPTQKGVTLTQSSSSSSPSQPQPTSLLLTSRLDPALTYMDILLLPCPHSPHRRGILRRPTTVELPPSQSLLPIHRQNPLGLDASTDGPRLQYQRSLALQSTPKFRR